MFLNEDLGTIEDDVPHPPAPEPSLVLDSGQRALERLISCSVPESELASLIEAIFSSSKAIETVGSLTGSDAQTFIDVMDGVCHRVLPSAKNELAECYLTVLLSVGIGGPRSLTMGPKEMYEVVVQDVCWSHPAPQLTADQVM